MVYCAHCGAAELRSKAYCRQCGKWIGRTTPDSQLTAMIIFSALSALFGAASAIALFSNLGKAEWPINMAGTFCLVISVYQTISFCFALNLRLRQKGRRDTDARELKSPGERSTLQAADTAQFIRPSSVTENTTELLERKQR